MFRFTTSAVAARPTPLATGRTPIPPRNFRVSSATAASGNSATRNGKRAKAFFMVSPPLTRLDPAGLAGSFRSPALPLVAPAVQNEGDRTKAGQHQRMSVGFRHWASARDE